jgi:flap endonuclease-1
MGIKCLKQLIRKHAPDALRSFNFNELNGKTIAIDSSILLYKFRYTYSTDDFHIRGFKQKIEEYNRLGIKPIFVFDGKPPEAKQQVLNQRKEIRTKMKDRLETLKTELDDLKIEVNVNEFIDSGSDNETNEPQKAAKKIHTEMEKIKKNLLIVNKNHSTEVIDLLKNIGVSFFESYGEAEEFCAFLQKKGIAEYILTEDTDCLAFGGTDIIFHKKDTFEIVNLQAVLEGFDITFESFIDLCILCGCDYTCKIPKVGPTAALKIIKEHHFIENFLNTQTKFEVPDSFDYQLARSLFLQNNSFEL